MSVPRVLIAEDNPYFSPVLELFVKEACATKPDVRVVQSFQVAEAALQEGGWALLIADLGLPPGAGVEWGVRLIQLAAAANVPCIVVSGDAPLSTETAVACVTSGGALDLFTKIELTTRDRCAAFHQLVRTVVGQAASTQHVCPPAPSQFSSNDQLPGRPRWALARRLGGGSFGEVWEVVHELERDDAGPRRGAVKCCTLPDARRLLRHEMRMIRAAMDVGHPHVVRLLDYRLDADPAWLLYEFVAGGKTLDDELTTKAGIAPDERRAWAVPVLRALTDALSHLHQHTPPLVHRDLKPNNVLMLNGVPKITDFGISGAVAAAVGSAGLPTIIQNAGNPIYAPPEQRAGAAPDPRNDVYALGVVAYQMLSGNRDAPGSDVAARLCAASVPAPLAALIARSVAEDIDSRPLTATAWVAALGS